MLLRSTIQLLRFHFSLFLLPVYLFALSQAPAIELKNALLSFFILHLLVYPSSNGYNSYMDRDETPIGGLASPLQPTKQLFYVSVIMDLLAIALSWFISLAFVAGIVLYILASRAYSYRGIRLKKYPVVGFLTVFLFQGALVFFLTFHAATGAVLHRTPHLPLLLSSLLIGALYPLTQIYQHEEDRRDGVTTISYLLGKKGTFLFSMSLFLVATACMYLLFRSQDRLNYFYLYLLYLLPVVLFFLYWMSRVWQDEKAADFRNSLRMNLLSTLCTAAFFITLLVLNH
ncbi:MAG TPA: UbiA family prenyltransferase [Flavisolibacter sp.]|nr:UbiA family prenyltransferase [Flavisolibacter sp.]